MKIFCFDYVLFIGFFLFLKERVLCKIYTADLTLWTVVSDLIDSSTFLHKYENFIASLEISDRAQSSTSRTFEKVF